MEILCLAFMMLASALVPLNWRSSHGRTSCNFSFPASVLCCNFPFQCSIATTNHLGLLLLAPSNLRAQVGRKILISPESTGSVSKMPLVPAPSPYPHSYSPRSGIHLISFGFSSITFHLSPPQSITSAAGPTGCG